MIEKCLQWEEAGSQQCEVHPQHVQQGAPADFFSFPGRFLRHDKGAQSDDIVSVCSYLFFH